MRTVKARPRRVTTADGPEVALIRYFQRFPKGSYLGFAKWQRLSARINVKSLAPKV